MKPRESAYRTMRYLVEEKTRKVSELERSIRDFDTMAHDLDRQIQVEEDRTAIRDPQHFSYSTYAKSARQRRDNLRASTDNLRRQLADAVRERDDALELQTRMSSQIEPREDDSRLHRRRIDRHANSAYRQTG